MDNIYFPGMDTQDSQQSSQAGQDIYFPGMKAQLDTTQQPQEESGWGNFQNTAKQVVTDRGLSPVILPVLLAQAADESARGSAAPGNNYFGIKGHGTAGANNLSTQEYGSNGYYGENDNFAAYNSPKDSINAYLDLILSYPGVKEAISSGNTDSVIKAIEANGYATSPTYVQDIENTPEFNQLPAIGASQ